MFEADEMEGCHSCKYGENFDTEKEPCKYCYGLSLYTKKKGMTIDDSVKQKLLNSLAEEPTMVLATAYAYAKNYVMYGEDITKAWTTAVQQATILDYVREKARAEAYDSFKKEYEARLKADMVDMLEDLDLQIDESASYNLEVAKVQRLIRNKIDKLKREDLPHCQHTDEKIAKSFIEDAEAVKDQLPTTKNDLGVDCISRTQAIKELRPITPQDPKVVPIAEIKIDKDELKTCE